jgi:hypothetical protein
MLSMEIAETFKVNNLTVNLFYDEDTESPRQWDNLGEMVCFHRRYSLGDKHTFRSPEEVEEFLSKTPHVALPLYLYDHSGITMSTSPFSCPWDSGRVGIIYVTLAQLRTEYNVKRITKTVREKAIKVLQSEVEEYDRFIRGEVYRYEILDENGEEVDSCGGFIGLDYAIEAAREAAVA